MIDSILIFLLASGCWAIAGNIATILFAFNHKEEARKLVDYLEDRPLRNAAANMLLYGPFSLLFAALRFMASKLPK